MHRLKWTVLLVAAISFAPTATALELVMVRRAGCPWCAAWDREIAPIYGKTDIGRQAPVRLVDLEHMSEMKLALQSPVRFTPTFVLVDEDREIGRIEGGLFLGHGGTAAADVAQGRDWIGPRTHEQCDTLRVDS